MMLFSFKSKQKEIDDNVFLDIVATHDKLPLFNYTVKMAAVDTRPFNPNEKKLIRLPLYLKAEAPIPRLTEGKFSASA